MSDSDGDGIVEGSIYIYAPNQVAPAIFAVVFAISGFLHVWQCYRYMSFKWTILHPLCAFMFTAGFAVREYGAFNYTMSRTNINEYIASTLLIYMSPPLFELANYHILGRVLYYVPYFAPLHPGRVLTTFGMLSTVVEVLNAIGVSYSSNTFLPDRFIQLGRALTKTGLILQIIVIALFLALAGTFHSRCKRAGISNPRVQTPLITLYVSTGLILARSIYRTVENFETASDVVDLKTLSPLLRHEWYFWVFEASLMLINTVMWNALHPGRYLPTNKNVYLAPDGKTDVTGPGWKDDRGYLMTVCDPFGFTEIGKRKDEKNVPFWETDGFAAVRGEV